MPMTSITSTRTAPRRRRTIAPRRAHSGRLFGERAARVPVTSLKSMIGHCLGAAGGIEAAALALTVVARASSRRRFNHAETDPECAIDVVANVTRGAARPVRRLDVAGFGGNDAALVITAIR